MGIIIDRGSDRSVDVLAEVGIMKFMHDLMHPGDRLRQGGGQHRECLIGSVYGLVGHDGLTSSVGAKVWAAGDNAGAVKDVWNCGLR
mmetsp:Transcript_16336/g.30811  ORF Transcript_16336/g.30811 Transcript_16336/m.30811 type:complete len:87 (-) Transcript_16336:200-460(-)